MKKKTSLLKKTSLAEIFSINKKSALFEIGL